MSVVPESYQQHHLFNHSTNMSSEGYPWVLLSDLSEPWSRCCSRSGSSLKETNVWNLRIKFCHTVRHCGQSSLQLFVFFPIIVFWLLLLTSSSAGLISVYVALRHLYSFLIHRRCSSGQRCIDQPAALTAHSRVNEYHGKDCRSCIISWCEPD